MKSALLSQLSLHPKMNAQDIYKLAYQASFGPEHLILSPDTARKTLQSEAENVIPRFGVIYEIISPVFCRVNLASWRFHRFPIEDLFSLFYQSAQGTKAQRDDFIQELEEIQSVYTSISTPEKQQLLTDCFSFLLRQGLPAVHHSDEYRLCEKPAYRVCRTDLIRDYLDHIEGI